MKILIIDRCTKCWHLKKGNKNYWCEHPDRLYRNYYVVDINLKTIPEWCPLEDAPQPDVEADTKQQCSLCHGTGKMPNYIDVEEFYAED